MAKIIYIYLSLFIVVFASDCKHVYTQYPILTEDGWSFRIDDKTDKFGCEIIPLYDSLRKSNSIELMDAMDDNLKITEEVTKLFKHKKILGLMTKNKVVKDILLDNAQNLRLLQNINFLFDKYLNYAIKEKIVENPAYMNYFILPSANAQDIKELDKLYRRLKKLSTEGIDIFSFMYSVIGEDYKFTYLMENFFSLKKKLSKDQLEQIAQYPENLAYFLYPSKEEMKIYGTKDEIHYQQKQFQELMITIYKNIYSYYQYKSDVDENVMALLTMQYVYPYIVENRNYYELGKLFETLVQKGFIGQLWEKAGNICEKRTVKDIFAIFGDDNLNNILRLQKNENSLYHQLLNWNSDYKSIFSFFYVVNVYKKFDSKKWNVFKNLLYTLTHEPYENVLVMKGLDEIDYFNQIVRYSDYDRYVRKNDDDLNGKSTLKYKFILFTSYPSDNDNSVYQQIVGGQNSEAKKTLNELYGVSVEELEAHDFTTFERNMKMVDNIDTALMVAALAAAPFTAGMSLSYVAVKQAGKTAAKKGIKYYAKKLALKSRKLLNKGIYKARKVRKSLNNPLYKNKMESSLGNILKNQDDKFSTFTIGAMVGGMLFLAVPNDLEAKQICTEEKE